MLSKKITKNKITRWETVNE